MIISMSIDEFLLRDIDKLQEEMKFSGRSDVIRTALRMLLSESQEKTKLKGIVEGVLIAIHDDRHSEEVSVLRHNYEKLVKTQIHNQLENDKCLEILVVKGNDSEIKKLQDEFRSNRKIDFSKLIIA